MYVILDQYIYVRQHNIQTSPVASIRAFQLTLITRRFRSFITKSAVTRSIREGVVCMSMYECVRIGECG